MSALLIQELIDNRLTPRLSFIQKLEAFNHIGRHIGGLSVQFPYGNWTLTNPTPLFRKNGTIVTPAVYDEVYGTADITGLVDGDEVTLDAQFSYFSSTDLNNFLKLAMARLNLNPPLSYFTFDDATAGTTATYPENWADVLVSYAYKLCLETVLVDLMTWRSRIIWTDPTALAGILQSVITGIDSYLMAIMPNLKGRSLLTPRSVSSGKWSTPATVTDQNWQMYTAIRA